MSLVHNKWVYLCLFLSWGTLYGTIHFSSYDSNIAVKETNSKLIVGNADKIIGWSEFSIAKEFGKEGASGWVEQYTDGVTISQEGSEDPTTNLIISNSNAINYGIKNNSNAIIALLSGDFTEEEKQELLEDIRTTSNAFLYCCKNTSNTLIYGIKNNSSAILDLRAGTFTEEEKLELLEDVRTTSNAFLYCCKNTSNALVYGIENNRNAIACFPLTICGCCDGCEPVARGEGYCEDTLRDAPLHKASGRPQGERGRGSGLDIERAQTSMLSPDNNYLAMVTHRSCKRSCEKACEQVCDQACELSCDQACRQECEQACLGNCEELCLYTLDDQTGALELVSRKEICDGHVYYVLWSADGLYLGVGLERENSGKEVLVYAFDHEKQTLQVLPEIDSFLNAF